MKRKNNRLCDDDLELEPERVARSSVSLKNNNFQNKNNNNNHHDNLISQITDQPSIIQEKKKKAAKAAAPNIPFDQSTQALLDFLRINSHLSEFQNLERLLLRFSTAENKEYNNLLKPFIYYSNYCLDNGGLDLAPHQQPQKLFSPKLSTSQPSQEKFKKSELPFINSPLEPTSFPSHESHLEKGLSSYPTDQTEKKKRKGETDFLPVEALPKLNREIFNSHKTKSRFNPLIRATIESDESEIRLLLHLGAKINSQDEKGQTPLIHAVKRNLVPIVHLLLENEADANISDHKGNTALFLTIFRQNYKLMRMLLHAGAATNILNSQQETPLMSAALKGNLKMVEQLVSHGASIFFPDNNGKSSAPLITATWGGNTQVIDFLLRKGASVNAQTAKQQFPLFLAVGSNNPQVVRFLLKKGVNVNSIDPKTGETALMIATTEGFYEIAQLLIQNNANAQISDSTGHIPIMRACQNSDTRILQLLLSVAPPLDIKSGHDRTPLFLSCEYGQWKNVILLLEYGHVFYNSIYGNSDIRKCTETLERVVKCLNQTNQKFKTSKKILEIFSLRKTWFSDPNQRRRIFILLTLMHQHGPPFSKLPQHVFDSILYHSHLFY